MLIAGVAAVGAAAIAVNPITPSLPTVSEIQAQVQQRAVELAAFENPLLVWQQTIQTTLANIQYGINAIGTETIPAVGRIATGAPAATGELIEGLFNSGNWQTFLAAVPTYAEIVSTALAESQAGSAAGMEELPLAIQAAGEYLANARSCSRSTN